MPRGQRPTQPACTGPTERWRPSVPAGAATIAVTGGEADGAHAGVDQGRFALWAPGDDAGEDVTITAYDAAGNVVGEQALTAPRAGPTTTETHAP